MAEPQGQQAASEPEVFLLYEGGRVARELRSTLTHVRVGPQVTEISYAAFSGCNRLVDVQLNEGLLVIGAGAFEQCTALRSVTLPSTVTELGYQAFCSCNSLAELRLNEGLRIIRTFTFAVTALRSLTLPSTVMKVGDCAFSHCHNLAEVQFNEGLQTIGEDAFQLCTALRSVTIPSTVTEFGYGAFWHCSNLSEVILLGGERLLKQEFLARGIFREEQGLLNQGALDEMLCVEEGGRRFNFLGCPLAAVKISISWALSERMARLPPNCRVPVEERIRNLPRLELLQDGNGLACFPVVGTPLDVEAQLNAQFDSDTDVEDEIEFGVKDTNLETARSLYRVLQLVAFHELNESSILIELAMWKSRIDESASAPRADCRVLIPDPAKILIMEYCGFAGFLEPAIEGAYE